MTRMRNFIAASVMAFTVAAPLRGQAAIFGSMPLPQAETGSDVIDARIVCNFSGCFEVAPEPEYRRPPPDWRDPPPDRRRPPPPDWGRGPPPDWDRDRRPPPGMRGPPREHVRWCMDRYRSYDPRSNSFIGRDGREYRCRSPWY